MTGEVRSKPSSQRFSCGKLPCQVLAAGREFAAPGELGTIKSATRGEFPFGFARQLLASPRCVGDRIAERHMHHRMIIARVDVALRPVGVPPISTLGVGLPLAKIFRSTGCDGGVKTSEPA